jgi:hypothetical protein
MADALEIDSASQVLDDAKKQIKSDLKKLRSGEIW